MNAPAEPDPDRFFAPLTGASGIVAAVSGGPDSMALMGLLAGWRHPGRPTVFVATVDHGLRPGSAGEAALVAQEAERLGLPHRMLRWEGPKPSRGLPEAAREARYRLLVTLACETGASHLVTAHTQDDQAETVLMRLARGSGPAGLAGMRPEVERDGIRHLRPLLGIAKADLVALCRRNGWPFVEDPTNRDEAFARPRWRRLAPALAAEGLTPDRLAQLAGRMLRADQALDVKSKAALAAARRPEGDLEAGALLAEPLEIAIRALALALAEMRPAGEPLRLERVEACTEAVLTAAREGRALRRTLGGVLLNLDPRGRLTLAPEPARRRGRPALALESVPHSGSVEHIPVNGPNEICSGDGPGPHRGR